MSSSEAGTGNLIKRARIAAGLSQSGLALAAGTSQPALSAYESGRRTPHDDTLRRVLSAARVRPSVILDKNRERVVQAVAKNRGHDPKVFGSVARDEDTPDSDIDLLVRFDREASLLDHVGLLLDLETIFGDGRVDLMDPSALPETAPAIRDARPI